MKIEIYDLVHKRCKTPSDPLYVLIQSGCALAGVELLGGNVIRDDTGDNISARNRAYNMLCPMYWVWKNSNADYVGIVHYRRLLMPKKNRKKGWDGILTMEDATNYCKNYSIIFPRKSRYPFFSLRSHYINTFKGLKQIHKNDLDVMREVIKEKFPDYLSFHDKVMKRSWGHQGNICLMRKDLYDDHCKFMFGVLEECEKRLKGKRHDYNRYIAALAEFLPDIWVEKNNFKYLELPLFMPEEPPFFVRLKNFMNRMFFGKRDPHRFNSKEYYCNENESDSEKKD